MFKKNNPGCTNSTNCRCSGSEPPPEGPCPGCDATQLKVTISGTQDIIKILPVHFSPGPCNWVEFSGFSAIDGTYYVDWPDPDDGVAYIELGRWESPDNPQVDSTFVGWCYFVRVGILIQTVSGGGDGCTARLVIGTHSSSDFSAPYTCDVLEDILFVNDADTTSDVFEFCVASSGTATTETFAGNADCAAQSFTFDFDVEPV